jgi:undecaprenyl-phosphate 4-deoxy-4-formamido-L-arabinose transferase
MDISVVVPVFNGEDSIEVLYNGINDAIGGQFSFEYILVHDCGSQKSWEIINDLANKLRGVVRGFRLDKNYGQHKAILFGISESKGKLIITLDDDLQHDPSYIPLMIKKQKQTEADVVYSYYHDIKQPSVRRIASQLLRKLLVRLIPGISPFYSPFRLVKKEIGARMVSAKSSCVFIDAIISQLTTSMEWIVIEHKPRWGGNSSYSDFKLLKHAFNILNCFSSLREYNLMVALIMIVVSFLMYNISQTLFIISGLISILLLGLWALAFICYKVGYNNSSFPKASVSVE